MGKWADRAFSRLKDKEGKEHERRQQQALNRQQILSNASVLWEKLKRELIAEVEDFERPGYLSWTPYPINVTDGVLLTSPEARIEVGFIDAAPTLQYEVTRIGRYLASSELHQNNVLSFGLKDEEVWFFDEGRALSVSDVAERVLDHLIE